LRHTDGLFLTFTAARGFSISKAEVVEGKKSRNTASRCGRVEHVKPAPFRYVAPEHLDEVLELLANEELETKVIAGGQSLLPLMNMRLARPDVLVDIRNVQGLSGISFNDEGALVVGAQVTQERVLRDPVVCSDWQVLAEAIRLIAHPQIRNRGTICGSMAHNDPAAELPALAVALDAMFCVSGPNGSRQVMAADMFLSLYTTALQKDEVLTHVCFPPRITRTGWAIGEMARRRGDFATIGTAVGVRKTEDGSITWARIVLFGAGPVPVRAMGVERLLTESPGQSDLFADVAGVVWQGLDSPPSDVHASSEFRQDIGCILVASALARAWERA